MRLPLLISVILLCLLAHPSLGQENQSAIDKITGFPAKFLDKLSRKAAGLEEKIIAKTEKALHRLEKQEQKLKKKLAKKDSLAAAQVFGNVEAKYEELRQQLSQKEQAISRVKAYIPGFDSLKTSLHFISQHTGSFLSNNQQVTQLKDAMQSIKGLEDKLHGAETIRKYLKERRVQLKEQLNRFGLAKELTKYNKQAYYYSKQIKEYQDILKDPEKLERKALELVTKIPAFQKFFAEHSELAQLFPLPGGTGTTPSLAGLQTRNDIQQLLQSRFGACGPDLNQAMAQNTQQAQTQLNQIKNKISQLGGSNGDFDMPDFKNPNSQKTKPFLKRWEVETNLQSSRGNNYLPSVADFGLSIGFKLSDKNMLGIGASYKMGWGKNIQHIRITHEGFGIRSFADIKLKANLWITGGGELNYRSSFENLDILKNFSPWQKSALVGIRKRYAIKNKMRGSIQLLYDFLWRQQPSPTQPIIFRTGYSF